MKQVPVVVSIRDDQKQWIDNNYFNLSKFVQKKLDKFIQEEEA